AYPPRNARHMPRIDGIFADAGVRVVLTVADVRDRIASWLDDGRPAPPSVVTTDEAGGPSEGSAWRAPSIDRHHVALLQYTSGSTGQPEGGGVTPPNLLPTMPRVARQAE